MNVRVNQICDGSYVCFFFFPKFFPFLAVFQDRLVAVHLHKAIARDTARVGIQAIVVGNQDTARLDIQAVEEGSQGIVEEDIQAAVEGSQGTVEEDIQLVADILAIVVGSLDIIGTHKAVAEALAEVLPLST